MALDLISILFCSNWLYSEARVLRYKNYTTSDDFDLTSEDKSAFQQAGIDGLSAHKEHTQVEAEINKRQKSGVNLRKNKNGTYDGRSKLGKRLNRDIPRLEGLLYKAKGAISQADFTQKELAEKPKMTALQWIKLNSRRDANRVALIICCGMVIFVLFAGREPEEYWPGILFVWITIRYTLAFIFSKKMKRALRV